MALPRFPTVRDLYDAFPTAADDVGIPASDEGCMAFLRSLTTNAAWNSAISLCAYILPRRQAVWWGSQSLRSVRRQFSQAEAATLDAAEDWVREPDETHRRAALELGSRADAGLPATWMALAAGWSGGSVVPPEYGYVRPPPEQTARAVRAGLFIAIAGIPQDEVPDVIKPCIEYGATLANQG
ncbi:MAG TPA: hypothetical protein VEK34_16355 [Methylocella sp.]|nr:hypothetical protein [Methylocella sp.]